MHILEFAVGKGFSFPLHTRVILRVSQKAHVLIGSFPLSLTFELHVKLLNAQKMALSKV